MLIKHCVDFFETFMSVSALIELRKTGAQRSMETETTERNREKTTKFKNKPKYLVFSGDFSFERILNEFGQTKFVSFSYECTITSYDYYVFCQMAHCLWLRRCDVLDYECRILITQTVIIDFFVCFIFLFNYLVGCKEALC